ncbi:hypothetical protein BBJ29_010039 [Phytophthora kernoviae]|uniref:Nucleotide-diphospho-sugar transferase domain-containing protein n=1 Tax=Phytophthora kernoviae TaxID=325452 RepID=A0A3F2RQL6_9STRA|nr:hypothetical protein BBP00_00005112 [Phytophthora kernoviae]RLN70936.1 hypothetical protein BBJ29_010039 [Phytophthora kernoviae]
MTAEPKNGVLMVMYPKLMESVYATIRLLRSYDCKLLVELWYLESEMGVNPLNNSQVLQSLVEEYGPISLRGIVDGVVGGFNSKVFALAHSGLDQVLFLDADNAPVKDLTYLFTVPEFVETGAIFWPDFWHPKNTIFNINAESPIWELTVQFLALRKPDHFERLKLLHGDKDLFRLAWLKTKTPFHMITTPAAAAGMVKSKQFCGMTMVQHDPLGQVLFLHHNGKKLIGEGKNNQTRVWTHLQTFVFPEHLGAVNGDADKRYSYMANNYHVRIYGGSAVFPGFSMCYGDNKMKSKHYNLTTWEDLPWHDLENRLNDFAKEASTLGLTTH